MEITSAQKTLGPHSRTSDGPKEAFHQHSSSHGGTLHLTGPNRLCFQHVEQASTRDLVLVLLHGQKWRLTMLDETVTCIQLAEYGQNFLDL